jgi:hypothetical protein
MCGVGNSVGFTRKGVLVIPHRIKGSSLTPAYETDKMALPSDSDTLLSMKASRHLGIDFNALIKYHTKGKVPSMQYERSKPDGAMTHSIKSETGNYAKCRIMDTKAPPGMCLGKLVDIQYEDATTAFVMKSAVLQPRCVLSTCNLPIEKVICPKYGGAKTACSTLHYVKARDQENFVHPRAAVPTTKKGGATTMRNEIAVILTAGPMVAVVWDESRKGYRLPYDYKQPTESDDDAASRILTQQTGVYTREAQEPMQELHDTGTFRTKTTNSKDVALRTQSEEKGGRTQICE